MKRTKFWVGKIAEIINSVILATSDRMMRFLRHTEASKAIMVALIMFFICSCESVTLVNSNADDNVNSLSADTVAPRTSSLPTSKQIIVQKVDKREICIEKGGEARMQMERSNQGLVAKYECTFIAENSHEPYGEDKSEVGIESENIQPSTDEQRASTGTPWYDSDIFDGVGGKIITFPLVAIGVGIIIFGLVFCGQSCGI